jgi:hypothetical protein
VVWFAEILTATLAAEATYRVLIDAISSGVSSRASVLITLAGAGILVVDLVDGIQEHRVASARARGADVALVRVASSYRSAAAGSLGTVARPLGTPSFSIPLLAGWYSFELLARTRRTYRQTVQALGVAPKLGGLARAGHVQRVAALSAALGRQLGVREGQIEDLETAAWLHHLGAVCLDARAPGGQLPPAEVAHAGAELLRASHARASAGDIVGSEPNLHRPPTDTSEQPSDLLGQILRSPAHTTSSRKATIRTRFGL